MTRLPSIRLVAVCIALVAVTGCPKKDTHARDDNKGGRLITPTPDFTLEGVALVGRGAAGHE